MSWTGDYWGQKGAIATATEQFYASGQTPRGCINLASVYYSAANRVIQDTIKLRWSGITKFNTGLGLAFQAVGLVSRGWWQELDNASKLKYDPDALDISLAVYHRYGWLRGKTPEARRLLVFAQLLLRDNQVEMQPHTRAFLIMHGMRFEKTTLSPHQCYKLEMLAAETAAAGNYAQASRVNRQLAHLLPRRNVERGRLLDTARKLAERAGATDQMAKM